MTEQTLPELNTEGLYRLIQWANEDETDYREWDARFTGWGRWFQGVWGWRPAPRDDAVCGSAYCQAGQAAVQAGYVLDFRVTEDAPDGFTADYLGMSAEQCYPGIPSGKNDKNGNPILVADTT